MLLCVEDLPAKLRWAKNNVALGAMIGGASAKFDQDLWQEVLDDLFASLEHASFEVSDIAI